MDYKKVYPLSADVARENGELDLYRESSRLNRECVKAIDEAIQANNYELYRYNFKSALKTVVEEYGFERVNWVLADVIQEHEYDGRYSQDNKAWAQGFDIPHKEYTDFVFNTHPTVLDGFIDHARKATLEIEKEAAQPTPDNVHGYIVRQYVVFDNNRGFALAENPLAVQTFVTWQLTEENGKRDYYWGRYTTKEETVRQDYADRISGYKADYGVEEKYNYLAASEMSKEQNYNMIDGLRNNEAADHADLTDGQTHEEVCELTPETLLSDKHSVLEQIKSARELPREPKDVQKPRNRDRGNLEL